MREWENFVINELAKRGIAPTLAKVLDSGYNPSLSIPQEQKDRVQMISSEDIEKRIGSIPGESQKDRLERIGEAYVDKSREIEEGITIRQLDKAYTLPNLEIWFGETHFPWLDDGKTSYRRHQTIYLDHQLGNDYQYIDNTIIGKDFISPEGQEIRSNRITDSSVREFLDYEIKSLKGMIVQLKKKMSLSPEMHARRLVDYIEKAVKEQK